MEGRHPFEVAVENWTHDFNIGSMVRTANAFTANRVHIVGPHKWNRKAGWTSSHGPTPTSRNVGSPEALAAISIGFGSCMGPSLPTFFDAPEKVEASARTFWPYPLIVSSLVTLRNGNELSLDFGIVDAQGATVVAVAALIGGGDMEERW